MEILFVTTELAPFVKVGGLADVSAALPKTLKALGHKVTIVMPRFPAFEEAGLLLARRLTPLALELGTGETRKKHEVTVYDGRLPSGVDLVLLDAPGLFDRAGVYGHRNEDYPDNAMRFAVLSRAVAEIVKQRAESGSPPDLVHVNDWPTALVSKYLKDLGVKTPSLLTIHNVAHQGVFPRMQGSKDLLADIVSADAVTTVSATYAKEIQSEAGGCRLDGVLRAKPRISGIMNGVDYGVWNPATDSNIVARYDAEDAANKARCKGALQKELGLAIEEKAAVIASVGRLVAQKGTDLVIDAIPRILRGSDAQVVIAGDGDDAYVAKLEQAVEKSHGRVVFIRNAPEAQIHRIFAGADIALVPSRFEPCGLVQLYAQRYGAPPVAHATGGLVDTIVDCDSKLETGTGFLFDEPTADLLYATVQRAIAAFETDRWPSLRRRVMRLDRGWERAGRQYEQAYKSLVGTPAV